MIIVIFHSIFGYCHINTVIVLSTFWSDVKIQTLTKERLEVHSRRVWRSVSSAASSVQNGFEYELYRCRPGGTLRPLELRAEFRSHQRNGCQCSTEVDKKKIPRVFVEYNNY
jgi:hypothetical protein